MRTTFLACSTFKAQYMLGLPDTARYLIIFLLINFYIFRPSILRHITFKSSNLQNIIFCLIQEIFETTIVVFLIFFFFLSQKSGHKKRNSVALTNSVLR